MKKTLRTTKKLSDGNMGILMLSTFILSSLAGWGVVRGVTQVYNMINNIPTQMYSDINKDGIEDRIIEYPDGKRTIEYGVRINDDIYYAPENYLKK